MKSEIVITGAGIVSAIGIGKAATLEALRQGRTGIGAMRYLQTNHTDFPVGEVALSDDELKQRLGVSAEPVNRTALLGMLALQEALSEADIYFPPCREGLGKGLPFINGTTVGGMDMTEQFFPDSISPMHDCGTTTDLIADHFGCFSSTSCVSTACSSAANAIVAGANMIRAGETEIAVVGGAECLTKFHLNGFNALMILDHEQCRPFDQTRAGLNLGEGAAYLVIETRASARRRGAAILGRLSGYGNACDAFHQTASSDDGEGAYRAMRKALGMAGLTPQDVSYVNAHGTGTPNNDLSESHALQRLFGDGMPPVSSTKGLTGHTTSASGAVEAVISLLALQHQLLPANYGWHQAMDGGIVPVSQPKAAAVTHVMCNSFGFGGNDTSLLISRIAEETIDAKDTAEAIEAKNAIGTKAALTDRRVFIRAAAQISMQQPLTEQWIDAPLTYTEACVPSIDPDFREWLSPMASRRMGRLMKRALVTALKVMNDSGISQPDAIVTGTGWGCLENTEQFLGQLCREGEEMLKPTHFMQSTHNTVSSLIAIHSHCHGYNTTYSQRQTSFDAALHDAWQQLRLGDISNTLVTGNDELTPTWFTALQRSGYVGLPGRVPAGEASVAMLLSTDPADALCEVEQLLVISAPSDLPLQLSWLATAGTQASDVTVLSDLQSDSFDLLVLGPNGTTANDVVYDQVAAQFPGVPHFDYKRIFGESFSASALGLYAASHLIACGKASRVLFVNHCEGRSIYAVVLKALKGQAC